MPEVDWDLEWLVDESRNMIMTLAPAEGVRSVLGYILVLLLLAVVL